MASIGIDDIIGHLNTLKEQEIQLKLKDEQIKKYEDLLLTYKSTRFDDCFLIYSYDEDQENIEIITKYFMEFTELAYDHHYLLIAKKESNRNVTIYLMAFEDDCQLESTMEAIDLLLESKRKQQEEDSNRFSFTKLIPEIRIIKEILEKKMEQYERNIKEQEDQLKDYAKKTGTFEHKIGEQTKKIEDCEHQLKEMAKEKEEQIRKQKLESFLNQKNFEMTKNSTDVLDGIGNRLSKREEKIYDKRELPLKEINSLEHRRKEVSDFIEFIRINWNNSDSGTDIQQKLYYWFRYNWHQFLYNLSGEEKEKQRNFFLNNFNLENTIGTIHFLSIQYSDHKVYFCFAIFNCRIVHWKWKLSEKEAYSRLYDRLKHYSIWTQNSKFATVMEVNVEQSDTFIHTTNKDVFVENEKVVTWIKNNFNMEQQNNTFLNFFNAHYSIIPSFYNFVVKFYDPLSN